MKKSALALMLIGFAATPAFAQSTAPPREPPMVTTPSAPSGATAQRWYTLKTEDLRASKIIGSSVRNAANESIGDVNEIVLDKAGRIEAVVIGVGGFLGMGEREVAVPFNQLQPRVDSNGTLVIMSALSREDLKNAPAFTWVNK